MLRGDSETINDDRRLAKLFNKHCINIVERFIGLKPEKIVCHNEGFSERIVLHNIKKYENHSSIRGCSSDIASSYFFRPSKVWSMLHHRSVGTSSE